MAALTGTVQFSQFTLITGVKMKAKPLKVHDRLGLMYHGVTLKVQNPLKYFRNVSKEF